jgi:hypothetical protein
VVGQYRDEQWQCFCDVDQRGQVFFADHVIRVRVNDASVSRHTNYRFWAHIEKILESGVPAKDAQYAYQHNHPDN